MNKNLFGSAQNPRLTTNEAGGRAFATNPLHHLAMIACTGTLHGTYYATDKQQFDKVVELCGTLSVDEVARVAVWAKEKGLMKDLPVFLLCSLLVDKRTANRPDMMQRLFDRIIKNGKDISNFVATFRSGALGRKSLGSQAKRMVQNWLEAQSIDGLFAMSVGNTPSLADVIKLSHPRPKTQVREAFYGWLLGREINEEHLPENIRAYVEWKRSGDQTTLPKAPYLKLSSEALSIEQRCLLAKQATFNQVRSAIATFARSGVLDEPQMIDYVAGKLSNPDEVRKSKMLPYNLFSAYMANRLDPKIPHKVLAALEDAVEVSAESAPALNGQVYIFLDVSGSMSSPVTGQRISGNTSASCLQVGAFLTSCILRKNPKATVYQFDTSVKAPGHLVGPRIVQNTLKLNAPGGGTDCSVAFRKLVDDGAAPDFILMISDNESWTQVSSPPGHGYRSRTTQTDAAIKELRRRNPNLKVACLDLQPYGTVQVEDSPHIMNFGGFSNSVYEAIANFANGEMHAWADQILAIDV